jgi:flagellar protein FliS
VSYNQQGIKAYQNIEKQSDKQEADPYKVIAILMKNALESINIAKITMMQNKIEEKGRFISLAITLIDGLKASLDMDKGGEIAENLNDLYDYMMARLVEANLKNDTDMLDEIAGLLAAVKEGWDGIADHAKSSQGE